MSVQSQILVLNLSTLVIGFLTSNMFPFRTPYRKLLSLLIIFAALLIISNCDCNIDEYPDTNSASGCQKCDIFNVGCHTCNNMVICLSCQPGYNYLAINPVTCLDCFVPFCDFCSISGICDQCLQGYYLAPLNSGCLPCTDVNCAECSDTQCFICNSGYSLDTNNVCQPCVSPASCDHCQPRYYLDPLASQCILCISAISGCQTCNSQTECTACISPFYINSVTSCDPCALHIPGCLQCLASNLCTVCDIGNGFQPSINGLCTCSDNTLTIYLGVCTSCSSIQILCLTCSSPNDCLTCQTGYVPSISGSCQSCSVSLPGCTTCASLSSCSDCILGYFLDSSNCRNCSSAIFGCLVCDSATVCRQCTSTLMTLSTNGSACTCQAGYAPNTNNDCSSCSSLISNCLKCTSNPALSCTTCSSGYTTTSGTCGLCSSFISNCQLCSSTSICKTCDVGYYLRSSTSAGVTSTSCLLCSSKIPGCSSCNMVSGSVICTACDVAGGYTYVSGLCACADSTKVIVNSVCVVCSTAFANCQTCSPLSTTTFETQCSQCNSNFFFDTSNVCQPCSTFIPGCITCTNQTHCALCDSSSTTCGSSGACNSGYEYSSSEGKCVQLCGDGFLMGDFSCDDGNSVNGDGCSSSCEIETDYLCINGSTTSPSVCSYSGTLKMSIVSSQKHPSANNITYNISVSPQLSAFQTLSNDILQSFFNSSLPHNALSIIFQTPGYFTLNFEYLGDIQNTIQKIYFVNSYPSKYATFAIQNSSIQFTVRATNGLTVAYYPQTVYTAAQILQQSTTVVQGVGLVTMLSANPLCAQLVSVLQVGYINNGANDRMNPISQAVSGLKYMNGYNKLYSTSTSTSFSKASRLLAQTFELSKGLKNIGYEREFLANFNLMFIIFGVVVLFSALFILLDQRTDSKTVKKISQVLIEQILAIIVLFNINNIGFSFGIMCRYGPGQNLPLNWSLSIMCILIILCYLGWCIMTVINKKTNNSKLKPIPQAQLQPPILILLRFMLSFCSAVLIQLSSALTYANLTLEILIVVYFAVTRPFLSTPYNFLAILNECTIVALTIADMCYASFSLDRSSLGPSVARITVLLLCFLINIGMYIYLLVKYVQSLIAQKEQQHLQLNSESLGIREKEEVKQPTKHMILEETSGPNTLNSTRLNEPHRPSLGLSIAFESENNSRLIIGPDSAKVPPQESFCDSEQRNDIIILDPLQTHQVQIQNRPTSKQELLSSFIHTYENQLIQTKEVKKSKKVIDSRNVLIFHDNDDKEIGETIQYVEQIQINPSRGVFIQEEIPNEITRNGTLATLKKEGEEMCQSAIRPDSSKKQKRKKKKARKYEISESESNQTPNIFWVEQNL